MTRIAAASSPGRTPGAWHVCFIALIKKSPERKLLLETGEVESVGLIRSAVTMTPAIKLESPGTVIFTTPEDKASAYALCIGVCSGINDLPPKPTFFSFDTGSTAT